MITHHSSIAHAAYLDLLRALVSELALAIRGTPRLEQRGKRRYWYDMHRVGASVRKRYIGEDSDETRALIEDHHAAKAEERARAANRTRLIRVLRAEGFAFLDATTGALLSALAGAGTFRLGGTLVGTNAFRLYEGELGVTYPQSEMLQTGDIDIAQFERLSLVLGDQVETPLQERFRELEFAPLPSTEKGAVWRWKQTRADMFVEFLTPSFRPEEDIRDLPALGVSAQSLHYLNYLIAEPIKAAALYRSGVLVQIPRPERFAIHKLIVADRRRGGPDQLKSVKDRAQAAFLIRALAEDRPDELREAYADAMGRGARWQARIGASLKRMKATEDILRAL